MDRIAVYLTEEDFRAINYAVNSLLPQTLTNYVERFDPDDFLTVSIRGIDSMRVTIETPAGETVKLLENISGAGGVAVERAGRLHFIPWGSAKVEIYPVNG